MFFVLILFKFCSFNKVIKEYLKFFSFKEIYFVIQSLVSFCFYFRKVLYFILESIQFKELKHFLPFV